MNIRKTIVMLLAAVGLSGCANAQKENITTVDVETFATAVKDDSIQLVDVRTDEEYAEGHINGALSIDVKNSGFMEKARQTLSKDRPVYVYCRSGRRSMMAAEALAKDGFTLYNLDGGIMAWQKAGLPTAK